MDQEHVLTKDCRATVIPYGQETLLTAGTPVTVTQTLGGNITVRTDSGLYRIAREDRDALGAEFAAEPAPDGAAPGGFSEEAVWSALKTCYDPEIPVNIVDLGLVYDLSLENLPSGRHAVSVKMTLTAQGCGMGPVIAEDARVKILGLPEVESADVQIVWEPAWAPQMISDQGRKVLGLE